MSSDTGFREIQEELDEHGILAHMEHHKPELEEGRESFGIGYPITGIEKFLGYFDKSINIANFPSISLTTDFSIAFSRCVYLKETGKDRVLLDGVSKPNYTERAKKAIEFFKNLYEIRGSFQFEIRRKRKYASAKGLGESAAIAAAAARSLAVNVFGESVLKDSAMISRLARLVSGSGTRSVTGGVSVWVSYPYIDEAASYGSRLPVDVNKIHFGCFPFPSPTLTVNAHEKAVLSPFYNSWGSLKADEILGIIRGGYDINHLLDLAQQDMFRMHSVMMSQGEFLVTSDSLRILQDFMEFQKKNEGIFVTADTGPSLVLLSLDRGLIEDFIKSQKRKFLWGRSPKNLESSSEQVNIFNLFEEGEDFEKR